MTCKEKAKSKKTQAELAKWDQHKLNLAQPLSQASISNILNRKLEYMECNDSTNHSKNKGQPNSHELDAALASWVLICQYQKKAITGDIVKEKTNVLADSMN